MNQHSEEKKTPNILALKSGHFTISLYRARLHKEVDITYKNDQDHSAILNLSLTYQLSKSYTFGILINKGQDMFIKEQ